MLSIEAERILLLWVLGERCWAALSSERGLSRPGEDSGGGAWKWNASMAGALESAFLHAVLSSQIQQSRKIPMTLKGSIG